MAVPLVVILVGVTASGKLQDPFSVRYLLALWVYPIVAAAILAASLPRWPSVAVFCVCFAVLSATLATRIDTPSPPNIDQALQTYPAPVACVDRLAHRFGTRHGFATYWIAARATELSDAQVRLLSVTEDLQLYRWIVHTYWWDQRPKEGRYILVTLNLRPSIVAQRVASDRIVGKADCPEWGRVLVLESQASP